MIQVIFWKATYYITLVLSICCFLHIFYQSHKSGLKLHRTIKKNVPEIEYRKHKEMHNVIQKETQLLGSDTKKLYEEGI